MSSSINIEEIVTHFQFQGTFISGNPYGSGHINDTYVLKFNDGTIHRYILQRINHHIFKDIEKLMSNISGVTTFLRNKIVENGGNPDRGSLTLIKTIANKNYFIDSSGNYYRSYIFIEDATTFQKVENPEHFYNAGLSIGKFQNLLNEYDASTIYDVIPNFHDTLMRFDAFLEALKYDKCNRAATCKNEIQFVLDRKDKMGIIVNALNQGEIPLKVTHNDTKLNNIMIDNNTGEGVCVIDLDTIMKGSLLYDFGDAIRFGANTASEDEVDLSLVNFDINLFHQFTKGFLEGINGNITEKELNLLPMSAIIMTLECGMRFLTDYLNGDVYFKIHRENHNLERAKNQLKLVKEMESCYPSMIEVVTKIRGSLPKTKAL